MWRLATGLDNSDLYYVTTIAIISLDFLPRVSTHLPRDYLSKTKHTLCKISYFTILRYFIEFNLETICPLTNGPNVPAMKVMLSTMAIRRVLSLPLKNDMRLVVAFGKIFILKTYEIEQF
jgi:hypothetical protein